MYNMITILLILLKILEFIIIAWVIMRFIPGANETKIGQVIWRISNYILRPLRKKLIKKNRIDFSPLLAIVIIHILIRIIGTIFLIHI